MSISSQTLLIDEDYIKKYSTINASVEAAYLYPIVLIAQDLRIEQVIGTDLMKKVKDDVAAGTLSGDYVTLVDDYIKPALLWWTLFEATLDLYVKVDNGGFVLRTSEDANPITGAEYDKIYSRYKQRAEHYTEVLNNYICENQTSFPEYTTNEEGQFWSNNDTNFKGGMMISGKRNEFNKKELKRWLL